MQTRPSGGLPLPTDNDLHPPHSGHESQNPWLRRIAIGTALTTGAVILAPYVLPALGIGTVGDMQQAMGILHGTGAGRGLAGAINEVIGAVPVFGETLSKGGWASAFATGTIGIGGYLVGRFIDHQQDGKVGIKWGKMIMYTALATSAFIAMPSILTGISVGLVFLSDVMVSNVFASTYVVPYLKATLGSIGTADLASSGAGLVATLPHLLTCGFSFLPVSVAALLGHKHKHEEAHSAVQHVRAPHALAPEVVMQVERVEECQAGKPCQIRLTLTNGRTGEPITHEQLATVHTEKIHLFLTDNSLSDFHHVHPVPTDQPGVYTFSFAPHTNRPYAVWADITQASTKTNYHLKGTIPPARADVAPAEAETNSYSYKMHLTEPLRQGADSVLEITMRDKNGNPVTNLEPVTGTFAHLVGFCTNGSALIHSHPLGPSPQAPDDRGGPVLRFHIRPDQAGPVRFFLQTKIDGKEVVFPFTQHVTPSLSMAARVLAAPKIAAAHMHA